MGQGPDVVKGLVEKADVSPGSYVYFDNLFSSVPLLEWLSEVGVGGTGTVTQQRMMAVPLPSKKLVEKQYDRGQYSMVYHKDIVAVVWKDNKGVCLVSNAHEVEPTVPVKRWSRTERKNLTVNMPGLINDYNCNMGGVDMMDKMVGAYRIRIRKKKWWWCIYSWFLSVTAVNAWRLMMEVKKEKITFLLFLRETVQQLLKTHGTARLRPGPMLQVRGGAGDSIRRDGKEHWIAYTEAQKLRCKLCGGRYVQ